LSFIFFYEGKIAPTRKAHLIYVGLMVIRMCDEKYIFILLLMKMMRYIYLYNIHC